MKKRLLSIVITLAMVLGMVPVSAGVVFADAEDVTPPVINPIIQLESPNGSSEVTAKDSITVSVEVTDESEVKEVIFFYQRWEEEMEDDPYQFSAEYNEGTGNYIATINIDLDTYPVGDYKIQKIEAKDTSGNKSTLWNNAVSYGDPAEDLTRGDFKVYKKCKIEFDSNGGTSVETKYIDPGTRVTRPDDPTKEGAAFDGWYSDEALTDNFDFYESVDGDIILYAKWGVQVGFGVYNATYSEPCHGGMYSITGEDIDFWKDLTHLSVVEPVPSGAKLHLTATPDEGYTFKGWYKGKLQEGKYEDREIVPVETAVSTETKIAINVIEASYYCAVFEGGAEHYFESTKTQKATPEEDGEIYQECRICRTINHVSTLPWVSNISLAHTSYFYTGAAVTPEVMVADAEKPLSPSEYDVDYSDNTEPGTATATVTLNGAHYEGTKKLSFQIVSASVTGITDKSYTGAAIKQDPVVKVGEKTLADRKDYTVSYKNNINAGTASVVIMGKGSYGGTISKTFQIKKSANPLKVKAKVKTAQVSYKKLKKKNQTIARSKIITFPKSGKGTINYSLSSAKKGKKSYKKYFVINSRTGKLTVKKRLKKGTYKIAITVEALGNTNYNASSKKVVKFNVRVK